MGDAKIDSNSKLFNCTKGTPCKYRSSNNVTSEITCDCGLNPDRNTWCPAAPGDDALKTNFKDLNAKRAQEYDNTCHTLTRGACYEKTKTLTEISSLTLDSSQRHLFYGAEGCVRTILGTKSSFLYLGSAILGLFAVMF